jgi:hypothetical protein
MFSNYFEGNINLDFAFKNPFENFTCNIILSLELKSDRKKYELESCGTR